MEAASLIPPPIVLSTTLSADALSPFAVLLLSLLITGDPLSIATLVLTTMDGTLSTGSSPESGFRVVKTPMFMFIWLEIALEATLLTMSLSELPMKESKCWGTFFFIQCLVDRRGLSEKTLDGKYFVTIQDRDWYWRAYLPEGEDRDHPACNPFGPRGQSLKGVNFPKSLVVVAGLDLVQDWQLAYVDGLKKTGLEVNLLYLKQATIGFYFLPNNDHFHCLMEELNKFVHSIEDSQSKSSPVLLTP